MSAPFSTEYIAYPDGTWFDWIPTFTNFDAGTGATIVSRYCKIGKVIHIYLEILLGTSPVVGLTPRFTGFPLMLNPRSGCVLSGQIVKAISQVGNPLYGYSSTSNDTIFFRHGQVSGANISTNQITATDPITFASGDTLVLSGTYRCI